MAATLAPGAQQGTAEPKPKKPRGPSLFMILMEAKLATLDEAMPKNGIGYANMAEAKTLKDARSKCETLPDGEYIVVSRRGKFTVGTQTAKIVKASK